MNKFSLHGEVALVTGGGSGLGLGIAQAMAEAGARVVIAGRREEVLKKACGRLGSDSGYHICDITDYRAARAMIDETAQEIGPLSILVNNAGNHLKCSAADTGIEDFQKILDTHVLASHNLTRHVLPSMIDRKHGSVLFIASMASFLGVENVLAYSAAKTAVLGMVRTYAAEVSPHRVRVNAIAPGWIHSPMLEKALSDDRDRKTRIIERTPMQRFGESGEIGYAAVYLCSPAASFVTGAVLPVDGGASIGF